MALVHIARLFLIYVTDFLPTISYVANAQPYYLLHCHSEDFMCHNSIWRLVVAVSSQDLIKGAVYSHTEQLWDHICQFTDPK